MGDDGLEMEQCQDPGAEYGAIRASINQEGHTYPRTVTRQDLTRSMCTTAAKMDTITRLKGCAISQTKASASRCFCMACSG